MKKILYIIFGVLVVAGIAWIIITPGKTGSSKLDAFANCIKDKGVTFYGAFWCPHCQAEKARFGTSAKYLPYVECSNPDGQSQTQVCIDAKITTYPTWQFPTTTPGVIDRHEGELELSDLSEKTGCMLPA